MPFQGKEFTQGMKQLVINLKQFNDIEKRQKKLKSDWTIEQTAKGLGIGQATVRRIMAEYNKNKQNVPDSLPKTRGKPEYAIPQNLRRIVRQYIRSQNLKGQHVSLDLVSECLVDINPDYNFATTTLWRTLSRWGFTWNRKTSLSSQRARLCNSSKKTIS